MSAVAQTEADQLIRRFIEGRREDTDTPHRDPDVLMHYYWDCGMDTYQVADELNTSQGTVSNWLNETGVMARTKSEVQRVERAGYRQTQGGYEEWRVHDPDGETTARVHQLVAVADGADPADVWADGTNVHHRTGIPWLNMPGFVEVLTPGEHSRTHVAGEWTEDRGIPVLETQD